MKVVCQMVMIIIIGLAGVSCEHKPLALHVAGRTIRWNSPETLAPSRMVVCLPAGDPYYGMGWWRKAIWNNDSHPRLVVINNTGIVMVGAYWEVTVASSYGSTLREGQILCGMDEAPYCLLEVKTNNSSLPIEYRNRWILAVGLLDKDAISRFDPKQNFYFYAGEHGDNDDKTNWIDVEPVRWSGDETAFKAGLGILSLAPCQCRPAEKELIPVMSEQPIVIDEPRSTTRLKK